MAPPTISSLLGKTAAWLKEKGSTTSRLDAELLLAEVLGLNRVDLYVKFDQPLNPAEVDRYRELVRRRGEGEPVAYILGRAYFHNLSLRVDRHVLVPRPETEHVVEAALNFLIEGEWPRPPAVLDLGTGSGAIAIAIAAGYPDAGIIAADASPEALELAGENARIAGLSARLRLVQSDMFDSLDPLETFDAIVCNPPYISAEEWDQLPRDVRDFEPREALYGGPDGLHYYRQLAGQAPQFLKPRGALVLEIGSTQAGAVSELLAATGRFGAIGVTQDYSGLDRVVEARRT
ncbi:MAG: peptide chain release factor N(5)-glutamine methyltransferase [Thermoleophilia bacterium]